MAQPTAVSKLDDPQREWGWFPRFVYKHRVAWWIWPALAVLTAASGAAGFKLLQWISRQVHGDFDLWMQSPGPWTALIVLAGLPGALFVWIVRDRNKATEHWQEQRRLEQQEKEREIQFGQYFHRTVEHAWAHFRQLQEWITAGNATLQTAAIHQLRPFIMGESGGLIPKELLEPENHFISSAMAVLRALLDDRSWLKKWEKEIERDGGDATAPESPVLRAIGNILRAPGLPWKDFAGWNLSELHLVQVVWKKARLRGANLQGADLLQANLQEADLLRVNLQGAKLWLANLRGAKLWQANLKGADLLGADLQGAELRRANLQAVDLQQADLQQADLQEADLQRADLRWAKLKAADLQGADLWNAEFQRADLTKADIEEKWREPIDWNGFNLKGMPTFVENIMDELPPKLGEEEGVESEEAAEETTG